MENLSSEDVVDGQSKPTSEYRSKRSDDGLRFEDECIFVFLLLFRVLMGFFAVNKSSVL